MCSIVMPADYEMIVSHSPPIFSHSPPTTFLSRCESYPRMQQRYNNNKPYINQNNNIHFNNVNKQSPKRPILVIRSVHAEHHHDSSSSDEDPQSPTRLKKRVVFADDRGMSLTHVRVMTEPSNVPPVWSIRFLAQVTHGMNADAVAVAEPWKITFSQPASNYLEFRKHLETNKVCLENVIIKENENRVTGTIKVCNLSYEKEVVVRTSIDDWQTHEDVKCTFVPNIALNNVYVLYDTFAFQLDIPTKSNKLDFCVCFRCDGREYWDNNTNTNYKLIKKAALNRQHSSFTGGRNYETMKCSDVLQAKVDSWSEFASWTHLDTATPYW